MTWVAFLWTYSTLSACGGIDQGSQGNLPVWQSPPYLRVAVGENVVMNCSFSLQSNVTSVFVEWNQEGQESIQCQSGSVDCHQPDTQEKMNITVNWTSQFSTLHIRNIQPEDNGTYYCNIQVEKPAPIKRGYGNGTVLVVTESEEASADSSHDSQVWLPGLLTLGVVFCLLCTMFGLWKDKRFTGMRSESPSNSRGVDHSSKSAEDSAYREDPGILWPVYVSIPTQQQAKSGEQPIYSEICLGVPPVHGEPVRNESAGHV